MASEAAADNNPNVGIDHQNVHEGHDTELMAKARFSKQMIEQKERELNEYISLNYNHIKDVERELQQLAMQVKLTADPKKHAMELLRKKIEIQNNKVQAVHKRYVVAKQAFDDVSAELQREEAAKQQLCDELNELVTTSVSSQLERFEQLKAKLQGMMSTSSSMGRTNSAPAHAAAETEGPPAAAAVAKSEAVESSAGEPNCNPGDANAAQTALEVTADGRSSSGPASSMTEQEQQQQEAEDEERRKREAIKAAAAAAAAALRAKQQAEAEQAQQRHVQLPGSRSSRVRQDRVQANQQRLMQKQQQQQQQHLEAEPQQAPSVDVNGRFAGFDA